MAKKLLTRDIIVAKVISKTIRKKYIHALWQAGSISFSRNDKWSDIDLMVIANDDSIEKTFFDIEKAILSLSGISIKYRIPEPAWHGHSQCFYRLKKASPYLFIDLCIMKLSSKNKFLQQKIHGLPVVHFDKKNLVKDSGLDSEKTAQSILRRLATLKTHVELFGILADKGIYRGHKLEAFSAYANMIFRPLVEVLRMKYSPRHYNFYTNYIHYDVPKSVRAKIEVLTPTPDLKELSKCLKKARKMFWTTARQIKKPDLVKAL